MFYSCSAYQCKCCCVTFNYHYGVIYSRIKTEIEVIIYKRLLQHLLLLSVYSHGATLHHPDNNMTS